MTAEMFLKITTHGAAVRLSSRAKFRLSGSDHIRYLNGQVTNDVRRAKANETLYACVTDAKGRIAGDVFIHTKEETLLLDAEPDLRETLGMRLERYIVADDVELADVTEKWQLWHVWGGNDVAGLRSNRFGVDGVDVWLPATAETPVFDSKPVLSDPDLETWRILQRVPRWPHELNAETFPPEAGLEARVMDFAKGCYIGQETLSRIKTTGKMPRELIAFECETPAEAGDELWGDTIVGRVTSATQHPASGLFAGLAMVKQGTQGDLRLNSASGEVVRRR